MYYLPFLLRTPLLIVLLASTFVYGSNVNAADEADKQTVAKQLQTLKREVIALNRDLFVLEEDLLFPSSTQLVVYLAVDVGEYFTLDAVELTIDDQVATYYLYTEKQVDALARGGVQRLHIDNIEQGVHQLSAFFIGLGPEGREFKRATSIEFEKGEDAATLQLNIRDDGIKQQPDFSVEIF